MRDDVALDGRRGRIGIAYLPRDEGILADDVASPPVESQRYPVWATWRTDPLATREVAPGRSQEEVEISKELMAVGLQVEELQGEAMRTPDDAAAMLRLREFGWGSKRIAAALGCSRNTVKRYLECRQGQPYRRDRGGRVLDALEDWLAEEFRRHRGNADVVRQDLECQAEAGYLPTAVVIASPR